jgi:hypothetical protein
MDYYDYDTFCYPAKHIRPLVEWPQHSLYPYNSLLSPDNSIPRIKQEDLGGFQSYPHHQQPRSYDAFNLPEQHSPYSAILLPLHAGAAISQQSRYYPPQSMQQQRRFPLRQQQQQQPAYHPQVYSGGSVQSAWDDDRPSALSSLVEMVDMDEISAMIGVGGVVEDTAGDEDAEGEDEWEEIPQQLYPPQYMPGGLGEVDRSQVSDHDPHVQLEPHQVKDDGNADSFEEDNLSESDVSEDDDDDDAEFVLNRRSSRKPTLDGRSSRQRSQSARYNPYGTRSASSSTSASNIRRSQPASSPVTSSLPVPIPVPNLTKKSRGRRVPTMSSLEDIRSAASGAGRKRQSIGGKSARMYLCEVEGCGKCFARGEHLKRHVRSIHTYEKREVWYLYFEAHTFTPYIFCAYSS